MAFSRKALRARREVRKNSAASCGYATVLREGEAAFGMGHDIHTNPYEPGSEDHETWREGWLDAADNAG